MTGVQMVLLPRQRSAQLFQFVLLGIAHASIADTAAAGDEVYRLASDARYARAGGDGSVFVLTGVRKPTPGAWIQECTGLADSLTRLDGKTGAVLWSTCLPVRAESLTVDAGGAVTMAGAKSPNASVRATPGAYASPGADGIVVIRLNPAGSAPEWIATIRGNPRYPSAVATAWTAAGPDGSVYGAATVTTGNLPVTETALQKRRPGILGVLLPAECGRIDAAVCHLSERRRRDLCNGLGGGRRGQRLRRRFV